MNKGIIKKKKSGGRKEMTEFGQWSNSTLNVANMSFEFKFITGINRHAKVF